VIGGKKKTEAGVSTISRPSSKKIYLEVASEEETLARTTPFGEFQGRGAS